MRHPTRWRETVDHFGRSSGLILEILEVAILIIVATILITAGVVALYFSKEEEKSKEEIEKSNRQDLIFTAIIGIILNLIIAFYLI